MISMKRLTLFGLCCATLLGGCTTDPQCEVSVPKSEQVPILLEGSINQVVASRADSSGFCNGDAVGIYAVNYDGQNQGVLAAEGNQADNVRFVFNFDEYRWIPDYDIYFRDDNTAVDIIGYYPYASEIENVYAYPFEVQRKQSTEATEGMMGGYESSDFLWGKAENIAPTTNRIKLVFHHAMAGVQVDLVEGSGFADGEWVGLDKQILVTNTIRKATIDLSTGEVTTVGAVPETDIIPVQNGTGWRAVVVPQTVAASTQLVSITVDGIPYSFRKDVDMTYTAGKLHKFTISVSKKESSGLEFSLVGEAITAWEVDNVSHEDDAREYVVVHNQREGKSTGPVWRNIQERFP